MYKETHVPDFLQNGLIQLGRHRFRISDETRAIVPEISGDVPETFQANVVRVP